MNDPDLDAHSLRVGLVTLNFPAISEPFGSTLALDPSASGQQVRVLTFDTKDKGGAKGTMHPEVERSDLLAETARAGKTVPLYGRARQTHILGGLLRADHVLARAVSAASGEEDVPVNTVEQAMATGLPVVARRHGGLPRDRHFGWNWFAGGRTGARGTCRRVAVLPYRRGGWAPFAEAGRARGLAGSGRISRRDRTLVYRAGLDPRVDTLNSVTMR